MVLNKLEFTIMIISICNIPIGFLLILISQFYFQYILEVLKLDNNPFKENPNIYYPGKLRRVANYYIKKNVEGVNRIKTFVRIENIAYFMMIQFFLLLVIVFWLHSY
jgi:hypothetical protein